MLGNLLGGRSSQTGQADLQVEAPDDSSFLVYRWVSRRPQEAEQALRKALSLYQELAAEFPAVPKYLEWQVNIYQLLGSLYRGADRSAEAEQVFGQALAILTKLPVVPHQTAELARRQALINVELGRLFAVSRRAQHAEDAFRRALPVLEEFHARFPEKVGHQVPLASLYSYLGELLFLRRRPQEAEGYHRKALELFEKLAHAFPALPDHRRNLAACHSNLGVVFGTTNRPEEAEQAWVRAAALLEELHAQHRTARGVRHDLGLVHHYLSRRMSDLGRAADEEKNLRQALTLFEGLIAEAPEVPGYRDRLPLVHFELGTLLGKTGRPREAVGEYLEALKARPAFPVAHNDLAWLLANCPDETIRDPRRAVGHAQKAVELAPKEGAYWNTLGVAQYRAGDYSVAVASLRGGMELRKGGDAWDWFFLALAQGRLGQAAEARAWYDKAVAWMGENRPALEKDKHQAEELGRLRAEGAALLDQKTEPKPKQDVPPPGG
jgi:tetratricopeptide (TPR) repeat protein